MGLRGARGYKDYTVRIAKILISSCEQYIFFVAGHTLKVTGARLIDDGDETELESIGGGFPNALDVCELYHESRVIDALRDWKEAAAGPEALSGRHEKSILETR
jgi:hypothetical protein